MNSFSDIPSGSDISPENQIEQFLELSKISLDNGIFTTDDRVFIGKVLYPKGTKFRIVGEATSIGGVDYYTFKINDSSETLNFSKAIFLENSGVTNMGIDYLKSQDIDFITSHVSENITQAIA